MRCYCFTHPVSHRVCLDPRYLRPAEVDLLLSDPSKAREKLNWTPKVSFSQLVERMVDSDLELAEREKFAKERAGRKNRPAVI